MVILHGGWDSMLTEKDKRNLKYFAIVCTISVITTLSFIGGIKLISDW